MAQNPASSSSERNSVTYQKHRHEVFWQITIPVTIAGVIVLGLAGLTATVSSGTASQMADASLITLIVPMLIFGLITLVMMGFMVYGVVKLIHALPGLMLRVHYFLLNVQLKVTRIDNALVKPVIRTKGFSASARALWRSLIQVFRF